MEIREMTAARIGREIKRKNLGVRETAEAFLEEIRQQEPRIHAFLSVDRKKTLERVRQVEQGIRDGRYTGPLAGVPVAIKDNICTKDWNTTCASRILENFVPTGDAFVIQKLQEAGMVVLENQYG